MPAEQPWSLSIERSKATELSTYYWTGESPSDLWRTRI